MYNIVFTVRRNFKSGHLELDAFVSYLDQEVEKCKDVLELTRNKLWKNINLIQATKIINYEDKGIPDSVYCIVMRARFNTDMKVGHMISDFEITRDIFEDYVKSSNFDPEAKEKLMSSLRD